jgi:NADP-dependent 3-hydroxy acid dehydrogenase YdfG
VRNLPTLSAQYRDRLLPLQLEVTDRDAVFKAVNRAHQHFSRLDVIALAAEVASLGSELLSSSLP